jgi:hypothetical protein
MDLITCPDCGHQNPPDIGQCQNCGADLTAGAPADIPGEIRGPEAFLGEANPAVEAELNLAGSRRTRLTPAQQAHTRLLQEMLAAEGQPVPPKATHKRTSFTGFRLTVALLLFLILVISLVTNKPVFIRPVLSPESLEARQVIYTLTPGAPVLVAFDYQPGFSGEMSRVAQGVLAHILAQRAYPVILSTHPTGPAQAELLLSDIGRSSGATYTAPDQYTNLGYLPGGASGLLGFSQAPRQLMPLTAAGRPAWEYPALQNIDHISDFSLVLIITEDPDTARAWIEQVEPQLEGKPLLLLLSAQAEPNVRPYYGTQSNQIQGLVSGVAGGVAYQDSAVFTMEGDPSGVPWSVYSLGLWGGAILLLLAGLYALLRLAKEQDNESATGEDQP